MYLTPIHNYHYHVIYVFSGHGTKFKKLNIWKLISYSWTLQTKFLTSGLLP